MSQTPSKRANNNKDGMKKKRGEELKKQVKSKKEKEE